MTPARATLEKIQIKHRDDDSRVLFECEVSADLPSWGLKLGAAIKLAIKARADLAGADLAGADLAGAYLERAYLAGADLARANLARADLAGAYLAGANLAGAYLERAYLAGADLAGANLAGANLARADDIIRIDCGHGWPLILRNGDPVMAVCGCRWMAPEALRQHWQNHAQEQRRTLMLPALDAALAIAKAKGWAI
jgi:uncharacterized protein YjbI with pentapeptide repeats